MCTRASRCAEKEEREAERSEGAGEGVRERSAAEKSVDDAAEMAAADQPGVHSLDGDSPDGDK